MYYPLISSMNKTAVTPSYTARTTAFASATGIVDTTILNALHTFDLGLISNGLDTKMKAVYPFVGGTATTHKYNFMDARDLDVAFRLQFNGGWIHSFTGVTGNRTNTYADTFLTPSNSLNITSGHLSIYVRTNIYRGYDMGCLSVIGGNFVENLLISRYDDNKFYVKYGSLYLSVSNADSRGHYITNRNSATNTKGFKNGVNLINSIETANLSNLKMYIGANNNIGTTNEYSERQYAFSSIGDGLTDGEATIFYNLVQAMQTSLSRNI